MVDTITREELENQNRVGGVLAADAFDEEVYKNDEGEHGEYGDHGDEGEMDEE